MFKVGDELIFRPSERRQPQRKVTVESVGRKWVMLSDGNRVDKESGVVDGGKYSSPGKVWTEEAWREHSYRAIQWGIIKEAVYGRFEPPYWLANDELDQIAALFSNLKSQIEEPRSGDEVEPAA